MTIESFLEEARRVLPGERVFVQQMAGEPYLCTWSISVCDGDVRQQCVGTDDDQQEALRLAKEWFKDRDVRNRERMAALQKELADIKARMETEKVNV